MTKNKELDMRPMQSKKDKQKARKELAQLIKEELDIDEAKYKEMRDKYSSSIVYKKHCGRCKGIFILDDFYVDNGKVDKFNNKCKSCIDAARKEYRESKKSSKGTK